MGDEGWIAVCNATALVGEECSRMFGDQFDFAPPLKFMIQFASKFLLKLARPHTCHNQPNWLLKRVCVCVCICVCIARNINKVPAANQKFKKISRFTHPPAISSGGLLERNKLDLNRIYIVIELRSSTGTRHSSLVNSITIIIFSGATTRGWLVIPSSSPVSHKEYLLTQ